VHIQRRTAVFVVGVRVQPVVEPADSEAKRRVERDGRVVVRPRLDPQRAMMLRARPLHRRVDEISAGAQPAERDIDRQGP